MSFTYKQIKAFLSVASTRNYAEASELMHITQPALSLSIKSLEEQIGGKLFLRTTRQVTLTPEGKALLPKAQRLIQDWEQTFQDVHALFTLNRGNLTIAAMPSFASSALPELLSDYHERYPQVKLVVLDVVMEEVVNSVLRGQSEIGITFKPDSLENLEFEPLVQSDFIVVMSPAHTLADKPKLSWEDLQHQNIVAMNKGAAIRKWFDAALEENKVQATINAEASQLDTLGQLVAIELGIAVVPALCRAQMSAKGLTCIELSDSSLKKEIGMIRLQRSNFSQAAKYFWEQVLVESKLQDLH